MALFPRQLMLIVNKPLLETYVIILLYTDINTQNVKDIPQ